MNPKKKIFKIVPKWRNYKKSGHADGVKNKRTILSKGW